MFSRFNPLSVNQFTALIALYFVCVFNLPFFGIIKQGIDKQPDVNPFFIASIPLLLWCTLSFLFAIFAVKYLLKPFFILLTVVSSVAFFAAYEYHIVFGHDMIENIVQSNPAEASMYVNASSILSLCLTGLLPAVLIYKVKIEYPPFVLALKYKLMFMFVMLTIAGIIGFCFFQSYAAFGRNNSAMKQHIVPTYVIGSTVKYINEHYLQTPMSYQKLGLDAHIVSRITDDNAKANLVVLIVGETARAMNYHYYGYDRPTNSHTQADDLLVFHDMQSCGTATAVSLPCMFSRMTRATYDERRAYAQDTALDVLKHAGVKVQWFDNDSGCKGVCDQIQHVSIDLNVDSNFCNGTSCVDQVLIPKLETAIAAAKETALHNDAAQNNTSPEETMIVLHLMGSHGPTYFLRYPAEHRHFTPDCQRSDIQNCSQTELVNTYDNTILYTDFILSEVINRLKAQQDNFNTAMLYVSDHGESLGENGLYLHGAPYRFAPKEQTTVPMLAWLPSAFTKGNAIDPVCLAAKAKAGGFSHDNVFDSVLGLMNVSTQDYQAQLDVFASCRRAP